MAEHKKSEECYDDSLADGKSSSSTLKIPSVSVDIQTAKSNVEFGWRQGRQIHRVPLQLRLKNQQQYVYDPMTISIGPYHHGKLHLRQMEEFKRETLSVFLSGSGRDKEFFYNKILEQIDEIRSCYIGVTTNEYDDAALSEMMLKDACFIIYSMKGGTGDLEIAMHMLNNIGLLKAVLTGPDMNMLENQIPYWIIKLLITLTLGEDEGKTLLRKHLSDVCFDDVNRLTRIPWKEEREGQEPLHLLEATQRIIVQLEQSNIITSSTALFRQCPVWIFKLFRLCIQRKKKEEEIPNHKILSRQFHSVTYLKKKGIHFRPSSNCLKDVRFKSHSIYGKLLLPVRFVNTNDNVFFSNLIAYELSPGVGYDFSVTSYINFMKRLIESSKDVKELREKGILFSNLASDEEVVKLFQEIDTMGVHIDFFDSVKMSIKKHCEDKSKTWIAELINTYFRNPWTAIALLAATFLLILTVVQTYYTVHSAN